MTFMSFLKSDFHKYKLKHLMHLYILHVLLLLSHFSRVQLCATPETAAHQGLNMSLMTGVNPVIKHEGFN